uniref:Uncharacterized protein n=1 Tax=Rhizophora mucronata TaxID=61149 RepID=A0A2P2QLT0_RHIMU
MFIDSNTSQFLLGNSDLIILIRWIFGVR